MKTQKIAISSCTVPPDSHPKRGRPKAEFIHNLFIYFLIIIISNKAYITYTNNIGIDNWNRKNSKVVQNINT